MDLGIDFGMRPDNFLATSNGLSFKSFQECRYTCAADKPYCQSSKCRTQREYFCKLASFLVLSTEHFVAVEHIDVDEMLKLHPDKAEDLIMWNKFLAILHSVATKHGRKVYHVSPSLTSLRCARCGSVNREPLTVKRQFNCIQCGYSTSRDVNAAQNILCKGRERHKKSTENRG